MEVVRKNKTEKIEKTKKKTRNTTGEKCGETGESEREIKVGRVGKDSVCVKKLKMNRYKKGWKINCVHPT